MNMWTAIFGIVAVSCITGAVSSYFKSRGRDMDEKQRTELEARLAEAERAAGGLEEACAPWNVSSRAATTI